MKKKLVSVILCAAMTATMLLGCSAGSEKSGSDSKAKGESGGTKEMEVDGDATTLNVWTCTTNYLLHWNPEKVLRM